MTRILLYGVNPFNKNRGVNALAYGAVEIILKNYPGAEIILLGIAKQSQKRWEVHLSSGERTFEYYYFSRYEYLIALINGIIRFNLFSFSNRRFRLFRNDNLTSILKKNQLLFNVNEGDSFSDIYGSKRFYKHLLVSIAALVHRNKIIFLPQTIGPFKSNLVRIGARYLLKRLTFLFIRDEKAISFLHQNKIPYILSRDISQFMQPVKPKSFCFKENYIGINISGLMYLNAYKSLQNKYKIYPQILKSLCKYFESEGINIVLLPHTYSIQNPMGENDYTAIENFIEEYGEKSNFIKINQELTAPELKYIISNSTFFIGSRMHACFAALTTNTPCFGLGYSYKFPGGFAIFGLKNLGIDISDFDDTHLQSTVNFIIEQYKNREEIKETLTAQNSENKIISF